jgi:hypothetical protein
MTLQELRSRLQALPAGEPITLDAALLGSDQLAALLRDCAQADPLTIDAPQLRVSDDVAIISGSATLLNVDELDLEARFFEQDGELQLRLTLALPDDWTFGQSFPNMAKFLSFDPLSYGYSASYLDTLSFAGARLVLASVEYEDDEGDVAVLVERGLSFRGSLSLTGLLAPLALISGREDPLVVSGLLVPPADPAGDGAAEAQPAAEGAAPAEPPAEGDGAAEPPAGAAVREFALSAAFPLSLGVDAFRLSNPRLTLHGGLAEEQDTAGAAEPAAPEPPPADAETADEAQAAEAAAKETIDPAAAALSRVEISAEVAVAGRALELFAELPLGGPFNFLAIGARPTFSLPSLGDLAGLVGDADLEGSLPESLQSFGGLTIEQLVAGFALAERSLSYLLVDVRTTDAWTIIPDVLTLESLYVHWMVSQPFVAAQRQLDCSIAGQLTFGRPGDPDAITLDAHAAFPAFEVGAALADGSVIRLGRLLARLGLPAPDDSLAITHLTLQANPKFKTFNLNAVVDSVLALDIGAAELAIERLELSIDYAPPSNTVRLAGDLRLLGIGWSLSAERRATTVAPAAPVSPQSPPGRSTTTSEWTFTGQLGAGDQVRLPELVNQFGAASGTTIDLPDGLDIGLTDLAFSVDTGAAKEYHFQGAFDWSYDAGGTTFDIRAAVKIRSWLHDGSTPLPPGVQQPAGGPVPAGTRLREGSIRGAVAFGDVGVDFFDNFTIAAIYTFKPGSKAVALQFVKGAFELDATLSTVTRPVNGVSTNTTVLTVGFGPTTTFGDLLTLLAQIVDPGINEFSLDPPWDELNTLKLSGLALKIDLTTKEVTVGYALNQRFFDGLVEIKSINLVVAKIEGKSRLMIELDASILGKTPPRWDALNQPPPTVPGKGDAVLDLAYLGLGQHVALANVRDLDTITKVITAMRAAVVAPPDSHSNPLAASGDVVFSAESGWLIGAQFTIIDTFTLAAIFNDPLIYGLRVELSGPKAQQFAGLVFEILYRRITDTIGVYHVELVLPDAMRQIQVGIVSLTLPVVVIDIYTNGDFKLDLGFPWNGNFERSFAINVLIFMGAGGFYFNKLSAATATSVPKIAPEVGLFNPVIEFGLGLKVGIGRTFEKGPLKAEISITLQGVVQGVFAWFHPNRKELPADQYYMVKGGVAIVGRLWGRVDFEIIQVEVEVIARAMIVFRVESYRPTLITLSAEVSVRASIKIVFITIHFSFSLTITQSFTLGSVQTAPWESLPSAQPALRAMAFAAGPAVLGDVEPPTLRWTPVAVGNAPAPIDIFFLPALTRSNTGLLGVALLFVENAIPLSGLDAAPADGTAPDTDFDLLAQRLLRWAIAALDTINPDAIALDDLEQLHSLIASGQADPSAPLSFASLSEFLRLNFSFRLSSPADAAAQRSAALFPMFPHLRLKLGDQPQPPFASLNMLDASARAAFASYFGDLKASAPAAAARSAADAPPAADPAKSGDQESAATFIFVDYFALLIRSAVQSAIDALRDRAEQPGGSAAARVTQDELIGLLRQGRQLQHLAGMTSRFMLHGLRLPWPANQSASTAPLYAITGQQFALPDDATASFSATLVQDQPLAGVALPSGQTALSRTLDATLLGVLRGASALPAPAPALQPPFADVPHHFNLEHHIAWASTLPAGQLRIFDLPEPMRAYLAGLGAAGRALTIRYGQPAAGRSNLTAADMRAVTGYAWATRLRVSLRKVIAPTGPLDQTYLLVGADEDGKDRLEQIWGHIAQAKVAPQLRLLHPSAGAAGLVDRAPATSLLLKTNLATSGGTADQLGTVAATLGQGAEFVKLLWECSVIGSGGYHLHYAADGAGLPEQVFADGLAGSVDLLVFFGLPGDTSNPPAYTFSNCLVVADTLDTDQGVLFAETPDTVKTPSLPAGHLGFQLDRAATADPLGQLYQLLGYQIAENASFRASSQGLPIGPAADDPTTTADDGLWIYRRTVPIFRFAKDAPAAGNADLPPADQNPYAGIKLAGTPAVAPAAQLSFYWRDVYGNQFGDQRTQTIPVRYTDPLLGINQWPTVAESYSFAPIAGDNAHVQLTIELAFEQQSYLPAGGSISTQLRDKIAAARAAYSQIYYQIHQPDISFTLSTTVLPAVSYTLSAAEQARLSGFVDAVYRFLARLESALASPKSRPVADDPITATLTLTLPLPASGAYPADLIFPLAVQLDMARDPALCDTSLGVAEIQRSAAFLKAHTTSVAGAPAGDQASEIASLRAFAQSFEQTFAGLRLAVGGTIAGVDDPTEPAPRALWAVQLGDQGIKYNIFEDLPQFFAPAPLSNTLLTGTVDIPSVTSDGRLADTTTSTRAAAIDLNALAREFLAAVEALLDPALALPAALKSAQAQAQIAAVLGHKQVLAAAIRDQVTNIIALDAGADISARRKVAADLIYQQLLINLAEAYDIETIVQYNVSVQLPDGQTWPEAYPPRLYGQPVVRQVLRTSSGAPIDPALLNFTLSPGKLPLAPGGSYLTFFFNTRTPEKFEDLTLNLIFRVNDLEHAIANLPDIPNYQASSWLSFILPIDPVDAQGNISKDSPNFIGDVALPIPLRSYPVPPSLVLHAAEADPDSFLRLEDIRQWQYTYVYEHLDIAQDAIDTAIRYNVVPPQPSAAADGAPAAGGNVPASLQPLFAALVTFAAAYPQLLPHLQALPA